MSFAPVPQGDNLAKWKSLILEIKTKGSTNMELGTRILTADKKRIQYCNSNDIKYRQRKQSSK